MQRPYVPNVTNSTWSDCCRCSKTSGPIAVSNDRLNLSQPNSTVATNQQANMLRCSLRNQIPRTEAIGKTKSLSKSEGENVLMLPLLSPSNSLADQSLQLKLNYDSTLPIEQSQRDDSRVNPHIKSLSSAAKRVLVRALSLPKFCWEAGCGRKGWIGHTQPRRLAARSVATRLATGLKHRSAMLSGTKCGSLIECQNLTIIKLMTDGILLSELQHSRYLNR